MEKIQYSIDEIQVGDQVLLDDSQKADHNLFWKVVEKIAQNRLVVEIKDMGFAANNIIDISSVVQLKRAGLYFEEYV